MRGARRAVMALAGAGPFGLLGAGPATAGTVEPLNQYEVSGKVDTDALARAGFDMREAGVTGKKGKFFIVATPSQAAELGKTGATVTAPFGLARSFEQPAAPAVVAADARLRRLPALEPEAGPVPRHVLHAAGQPQDLLPPARGRELGRGEGGGHRPLGPRAADHGLQGPQRRPSRARRHPPRGPLQLHAARARVDRHGDRAQAVHVLPRRTSATSPSRSCSTTARSGSCPSSTSTVTTTPSSTRARACGARTYATSTAAASARTSTASTPTATGRRSGTTTRRAPRRTPPTRPTTARGRHRSLKCRRCAGWRSA